MMITRMSTTVLHQCRARLWVEVYESCVCVCVFVCFQFYCDLSRNIIQVDSGTGTGRVCEVQVEYMSTERMQTIVDYSCIIHCQSVYIHNYYG